MRTEHIPELTVSTAHPFFFTCEPEQPFAVDLSVKNALIWKMWRYLNRLCLADELQSSPGIPKFRTTRLDALAIGP